MRGDVVTVTSGKGGVGKTTTAVNLAVALRQRGHPVVVLDADLGMPNVEGLFDLETELSVHDVLAGEADVEEAVHELAEGLAVLAGDRSLDGFADADPTELESVVEALAERYRYVVVDTGGGLTYEGLLPLELGDEAILVTSPDPAAMGDTTKSKELAARLDVPIRGVVVTHATDETDADAVAGDLDADLMGTVPLESAVSESTAAGIPVAAFAPESRAAAAYDRIAAGMADDAEATLEPLDSKARKPDDPAPDDANDAEYERERASTDADADDPVIEEAETAQATDGGPEVAAEDGDASEPADVGTEDSSAATEADEKSGGFFSRLAGIFG